MPESQLKSKLTRIDSVIAEIRGRIASRKSPPGARLPSVRAQAKAMGCSVSTVVEAYERLAAEGLIRARPGSGFYVSGPAAPLALAEIGPKIEREVDPLWISRQSLSADEAALMPGCGWLPASWMPEENLRRALRAASRAQASELADYAPPLGSPELRRLLARRMAGHGVEAAPDQIMLTESGTQAIDLICRLLLEPGDVVLVDDPCYFNFHALLKAHRARILGVPYVPNGPDLAAFAEAVRTHRPRLYVTNAAIHNPTGAVLAPHVAHGVLKLAEEVGLIIVEDEIFADFETVPAPRLAALDGLNRVLSIGSFSKSLSAAARCGYVAARPDWIDNLVDLKLATSFSGGGLEALILLKALTDGGYRKHMDSVRQRLARAMERTDARLTSLGLQPWIAPREGMFLWRRLPDGLDATRIARACLKEGVILAPGNAFSQSRGASGFLRFNAAQSADERIYTALARAMEAGAASGGLGEAPSSP